MPRAYSDREREWIRERLMQAAEERFARFGLRKTTIDELVRDAGISKGGFYQFFESKELLFFAVQERIELEIQQNLGSQLAKLDGPGASLQCFFRTIIEALDKHPFLRRVADPEVHELVYRRLPEKRLQEHRERDRSFYLELFNSWIRKGWITDARAEALLALLGAFFLLFQHKAVLGEQFEEVLSILSEGICRRLLGE